MESDLCESIKEALKDVKIPDNIQLTEIFQEQIRPAKLDNTFLKRILSNLLINAIQAMPQGGKLIIRASQDADNTFITVEDTGVGIPPEAKNKIFTPLFTTKAKGQGFGLPVVKRMTEAMNGTVTFESEISKGTKFVVAFPKKPQDTVTKK